jgi:hypothetical protein
VKLRERFWDWATDGFIRFTTLLFVAHKVLTTDFKKKEH